MLIPINKEYIIKHIFNEKRDNHYRSREQFIEDYTNTIYPYPKRMDDICMYYGHIPIDNTTENVLLELDKWDDNDEDDPDYDPDRITYNKNRSGIILEDNLYYFTWDGVIWIVPKDIYDQLDECHILVGDFSSDIFNKHKPTNAKVIEIVVNEDGTSNVYEIIDDENLLIDMSNRIHKLFKEELFAGGEGFVNAQTIAITSILDEIAHRRPFGDIGNDVADKNYIYDNIVQLKSNNELLETNRYAELGLKNIIWEMLDHYGYTNFGFSITNAWLEETGWLLLQALRWEALSANYKGNILYGYDGKIEAYNNRNNHDNEDEDNYECI